MLVGALVPGAEQVRDRCSKPRSITITGFQVALTSETVSNHVLAKLGKKKKVGRSKQGDLGTSLTTQSHYHDSQSPPRAFLGP